MTTPLVPQICPHCDVDTPRLVVSQEDGCGDMGHLTLVELSCRHVHLFPSAWLQELDDMRRVGWGSTS